MRREAARSRSFRVRAFWFGRPLLSVSVTSALRQLLHDGGEVQPNVLALDIAAVAELHDVEQPEAERAVAALQPERLAGCPPAPDGLIDHEVVPVEALH